MNLLFVGHFSGTKRPNEIREGKSKHTQPIQNRYKESVVFCMISHSLPGSISLALSHPGRNPIIPFLAKTFNKMCLLFCKINAKLFPIKWFPRNQNPTNQTNKQFEIT